MDNGTRLIGILVLGGLVALAAVCGTVLKAINPAADAGLKEIALLAAGAIAGLIPGPPSSDQHSAK